MAPNRDPELLAAISEAVSENTPVEQDFDESWSTWEGEQAPSDGSTPPGAASGESQTQTAEGPNEPVASTEPTEAVEPPTEFWGVDLSDIPAEARAAILSKLEQQEGTIHKLQQRLTEERTPEPVAAAAEEEELTDEDILVGLGIDPEDYSVTAAQRDAMLRMARATMALEERVESMYAAEQTKQVESAWNSELDALEAKHGKLPGTRLQVLQYAVEEGVTDPAGLYFRLTAEPRQEIDKAVAEARRQALQTEARGGVAPRSTNAGADLDFKGMSMKDAITAAARAAEKESGLKWKDSIKRVVTSPTGFQGA